MTPIESLLEVARGLEFGVEHHAFRKEDEADILARAAARDIRAAVKDLTPHYERLRAALERIASTGTDCPAAGQPAAFFRDGLLSAIVTAAIALEESASATPEPVEERTDP